MSGLYDAWRKWYCRWCDCRTETVVLNHQAWCVRCDHAKRDDNYGCPHCGTPSREREPLAYRGYRSSPYAAYEFGLAGHTWEECHRCTACGRRYWFGNADF